METRSLLPRTSRPRRVHTRPLSPTTHLFSVNLEQETDGRWSVWVPKLPGCASWGDTREEAVANIQEAIECHVEALKGAGRLVPVAPLLPKHIAVLVKA